MNLKDYDKMAEHIVCETRLGSQSSVNFIILSRLNCSSKERNEKTPALFDIH